MKKKIIITCVCAILLAGVGFAGIKAVRELYRLYYQMLGLIEYYGESESRDASSIHSLMSDIAILSSAKDRTSPMYQFHYDWVKGNRLIAHAMGVLGEQDYTNSLEAFHESYEKGYRVFEIDFDLTEKEHALILSHGDKWAKDRENSYYSFFHRDVSYTPLDFDMVLDLMMEYPDIYIVTDTKYPNSEEYRLEFNQIVYQARRKDFTLLNRIIPQVYNEQMLYDIMNIYPFNSVIYTLYFESDYTPESVAEMCKRTGVGFVTMPIDIVSWNPIATWGPENIIVAVHTINKTNLADELFSWGYTMLYSDSLNPADYESELDSK